MLDRRLCEIVRDVIGDEDLVLDESTSARDVEGWDSLAHINIMVAVESVFGVNFTSDELTRFEDLGQLQQHLQQRAP